jgi:hypothetical protein
MPGVAMALGMPFLRTIELPVSCFSTYETKPESRLIKGILDRFEYKSEQS